jgi:Ca2+-binding EF-hand superfamily protein
MRESFDVLDSNNTNAIDSAAVASMLEQMGMENNPAALRSFFPPNAPAQLNLARYLDTLSAPLAELSPPEELMAAFSAFDVDDSGQIDVVELKRCLLGTAPEAGEEDYRMSERELDAILGEYSGRRAFGAKGVNVAKGKGEVFKYRDFMGAINGGSGNGAVAEVEAI